MSSIGEILKNVASIVKDGESTLENLFLQDKPTGRIVPEGHPGFAGIWPQYIPPQEGDSRGPCPGLNVLANHGILPRNGRNIPFDQLTRTTQSAYNISDALGVLIPTMAAKMLKRDYNKDTLDLEELALHNAIEHDASLTRPDTALDPDQSYPRLDMVEALLASATGKDEDGHAIFTPADMARYISKRRAESKATNPKYKQDLYHKLFSSTESALLLTVFGGRVDAIRVLLAEERFVKGWETNIKSRKGLTLAELSMVGLEVELAVDKKEYAALKVNPGHSATCPKN